MKRKNNRIYKIDKNGKKRRVFWIRGLNVIWYGSNATIILYEPCVRFRGSTISMGENSTAIFKRSRTKLKKMDLYVNSENGSLEIGENLLPNFHCRINVYREPNLHVKIGDNCMMGPNVEISASDAHCIYQTTDGKVINKGKELGVEVDVYQSNIEGEIVEKIQQARGVYDGILINAGGYTHTSVVIRDAIAAVQIPTIEVHMTNIHAREEFRHTSLLSGVCKAIVAGFGEDSYILALEGLVKII